MLADGFANQLFGTAVTVDWSSVDQIDAVIQS
jgi:hypothetical protein